MYPTLSEQIDNSIYHASRFAETASLTGEAAPSEGYDAIEAILERALSRVDFLRMHEHEWDDCNICFHCGADGNA